MRPAVTWPRDAEAAQAGRNAGIARYVVLGAAALVLLFLSAKALVRRRRFLSNDPREIATACRRELVGYLLDIGITIPRDAVARRPP